jgi:hypothetical protein
MYEIIEKKKWLTNMCECDAESCILSHILPCHIYAKLNGKCYLFNFLSYAFLLGSIYNVYYWLILFSIKFLSFS